MLRLLIASVCVISVAIGCPMLSDASGMSYSECMQFHPSSICDQLPGARTYNPEAMGMSPNVSGAARVCTGVLCALQVRDANFLEATKWRAMKTTCS